MVGFFMSNRRILRFFALGIAHYRNNNGTHHCP